MLHRGATHSDGGSSLTREHHLHQISLLDVTGTFDKLQDVVGGRVVFEQQNLVIDAIKAALGELQRQRKGKLCEWGGSALEKSPIQSGGKVFQFLV